MYTINIVDDEDEFSFQNPTMGDVQVKQPKLLTCTLKDYQLKGLNWLANLYEQGINGILADEMVSPYYLFRFSCFTDSCVSL